MLRADRPDRRHQPRSGERDLRHRYDVPGTYAGFGIGVSSNFTVAIEGNFIGTNAAGTAAIPNYWGIAIADTPGVPDTEVVGGLTATPGTGAGNLISGNVVGAAGAFGKDGTFLGNLIGTDKTGKYAIPNQTDGLNHVDVVGGTVPGSRNIISGNTRDGVAFARVIQGNYIGTDISGSIATGTDGNPLGNRLGVNDDNGNGASIGGSTPAARNIIAGNLGGDIGNASGTGRGQLHRHRRDRRSQPRSPRGRVRRHLLCNRRDHPQ